MPDIIKGKFELILYPCMHIVSSFVLARLESETCPNQKGYHLCVQKGYFVGKYCYNV